MSSFPCHTSRHQDLRKSGRLGPDVLIFVPTTSPAQVSDDSCPNRPMYVPSPVPADSLTTKPSGTGFRPSAGRVEYNFGAGRACRVGDEAVLLRRLLTRLPLPHFLRRISLDHLGLNGVFRRSASARAPEEPAKPQLCTITTECMPLPVDGRTRPPEVCFV